MVNLCTPGSHPRLPPRANQSLLHRDQEIDNLKKDMNLMQSVAAFRADARGVLRQQLVTRLAFPL
eukprot:2855652-Amphidinium_carterae.1